MAEKKAQEVRGERLWQEMKWEGKQGPQDRSSLSSGIQAPSNCYSSILRVCAAFILIVQNGCQSSSHHMHLSNWTSTLALQTQFSQKIH